MFQKWGMQVSKTLSSFLLSRWYRKVPPFYFYLLWPFTVLFRMIIWGRGKYLVRAQVDFKIPVIIVGNITVGGTGKTPCVLALTQFFIQKGYRPAILTRGYRGDLHQFPHSVALTDDPKQVGDEPYLLALRSNVPVIVDPVRNRGAQYAISLGATVLISDDGLQHYRLKRDLEIVMVDGVRKFGNQCLLPMGPLREPISRLSTVDCVIETGRNMMLENILIYPQDQIHQAISLSSWILKLPENTEIAALAGVGNPDRFFALLRAQGLENFSEHPFSDHHAYQSEDLLKISASMILMTEKDMVKCRQLKDPRLWTVSITGVLDPGLLDQIFAKINK